MCSQNTILVPTVRINFLGWVQFPPGYPGGTRGGGGGGGYSGNMVNGGARL